MANYSNQSHETPPVKPNSTLALASLILGIGGWTFIPFLGSIGAIITGHMAKTEIKKSMGGLGGDGMATAGLVLGYAGIVLGLCLCIVIFVLPLLGFAMSIPFLESSGF